MSQPRHPVFTIGHSAHTIDEFIGLLRRHGVDAVADVRSMPYSRVAPQFNREALARRLRAEGIRYVFLGEELGGRPADPSCYENGQVRYERLAQTERFKYGIERVIRGANRYRIALMCTEKEPLECHRTLLVARALHDRGVDVRHILADGRLEAHEMTMERLLDLLGLRQVDLFGSHSRSHEEMLADAIARQASKVAWSQAQ
uniref:DUF488 domain-containing protein n=1 Tax=Thermorudis sp. TaxID=1969470 RepID=A0A7C2WT04_9BACT